MVCFSIYEFEFQNKLHVRTMTTIIPNWRRPIFENYMMVIVVHIGIASVKKYWKKKKITNRHIHAAFVGIASLRTLCGGRRHARCLWRFRRKLRHRCRDLCRLRMIIIVGWRYWRDRDLQLLKICDLCSQSCVRLAQYFGWTILK